MKRENSVDWAKVIQKNERYVDESDFNSLDSLFWPALNTFKEIQDGLSDVITGAVYWDRLYSVYSNATLFPKDLDHLYYDIEQSSLGDCYFLSSIAVINESILQDLFVTKSINEQGLYLVNFYIRGRKWVMSVDDEFLFEKKYDNLRFSKYRPESNTLWVPIIEKAFAKLRGNYDNVIAGNPANALRLLTGVPVYEFSTFNTTLESIWFHIQHATQMSYLMTAET